MFLVWWLECPMSRIIMTGDDLIMVNDKVGWGIEYNIIAMLIPHPFESVILWIIL